MLDTQSRVTVIGARKRVDVAVPTATPIGEYVAGLADLCGQQRRGPLPHAWSLALAGAAPLALDASLGSVGIADGEALYLRDLARDPGTDPVVDDVDELVAAQAQAQRDNSPPHGLVVISFGLLWLVATAMLALRFSSKPIGGAVLLILAGLGLIAGGWSLHQRQSPVPAVLRLVVALTAVPCPAVAGALVAQALAGSAYAWCGAISGVNVAALMAVAAIPEPVLIAVELQFAVAAGVAPLLILADASGTQSAAAAVVVALALLGTSKVLAATIAVSAKQTTRDATSVAEVVTDLLIRSRRLLTVVIAGPAVALAVAFVVLAASGGGYAVALTAVAGVALLVRARQRGFADEVVLIAGAGLVGLFAALTSLLNTYAPGSLMVGVFAVAGLGLVVLGMALTMMHRARQRSVHATPSPDGVSRRAPWVLSPSARIGTGSSTRSACSVTSPASPSPWVSSTSSPTWSAWVAPSWADRLGRFVEGARHDRIRGSLCPAPGLRIADRLNEARGTGRGRRHDPDHDRWHAGQLPGRRNTHAPMESRRLRAHIQRRR